MYLKKILLTVVLLGLVGMAGFSYYVYQNIFTPNTGLTTHRHMFLYLQVPHLKWYKKN